VISLTDEILLFNKKQLLNAILSLFEKHQFLNLSWSNDLTKFETTIGIHPQEFIFGAWRPNSNFYFNELNLSYMNKWLRFRFRQMATEIEGGLKLDLSPTNRDSSQSEQKQFYLFSFKLSICYLMTSMVVT
jgi:hypothetical protein